MTQQPPQIVSRKEWGAVEPLIPVKSHDLPRDSAILSWTTDMETSEDRSECTSKMRALQLDHIAKGEPDICYNFCICGDGLVYEGRGWTTAHSAQLEYPESYGKTLVIGVFGERRKEFDGSWYGSHKVMLPGFSLVKYGFDNNYVKSIFNFYEDHENVIKTLEAKEEEN